MSYTTLSTKNHGDLRGRNIENIIRRIYGRGASVTISYGFERGFILDRDGFVIDRVLNVENELHEYPRHAKWLDRNARAEYNSRNEPCSCSCWS